MFITFEGPDGAGKTSILNSIMKRLNESGETSVVFTREPGGSPIAEQIRHIILNPDHIEMDIRTEALLYAASRRQHLVETIFPALKAGKIIICDRFVDSSIVYQGFARGIGMDAVAQINQFATENVEPTVTFYLDVPAEIGIERIEKNKKTRQFDRLDQETIDFHQKVREGYLILLERHGDRFIKIDASRPEEEVLEECWSKIKQLIYAK